MGLSLHASRFGLAEQKFNRWDAIQPAGEDFSACLNPGYWAHIAVKLRIGDEIRVTNDEGNLYAMLYVVNRDRTWAQVAVIHKQDLSAAEIPQAEAGSDYRVEVEFAGRYDKHRVVRVRSGQKETLSKGHETKESAMAWAADHMRTVGVQKAA